MSTIKWSNGPLRYEMTEAEAKVAAKQAKILMAAAETLRLLGRDSDCNRLTWIASGVRSGRIRAEVDE